MRIQTWQKKSGLQKYTLNACSQGFAKVRHLKYFSWLTSMQKSLHNKSQQYRSKHLFV